MLAYAFAHATAEQAMSMERWRALDLQPVHAGVAVFREIGASWNGPAGRAVVRCEDARRAARGLGYVLIAARSRAAIPRWVRDDVQHGIAALTGIAQVLSLTVPAEGFEPFARTDEQATWQVLTQVSGCAEYAGW